MKPIAIADDLLIGTEPIPGTSTYVGVTTSMVTVTPDSSVRVAGVVQTRSRAAVACQVQLQSGWPAGRPPLLQATTPAGAVWQSNGVLDVPAPSEALPRTFEFSGSQLYRFFFPLIRVRWVLRTHDGSALLSTDYVVVSAQIRPYPS